MYYMPAGFAVIISAPSGTGKSTVCKKLLQRDKTLRFSLSCTTRPPRPEERNGRDYHFLSQDDFKRKIHKGDFLEWASVHGNFYGTPKAYFDETIAEGKILMLAIDVQGAKSIHDKRPESVTIFLMPPTWQHLEQRLSSRRHDSRETLARRMANAPAEVAKAKDYDYLVVNDSLDEAVKQIEAIIQAEKLRTSRQDLSAFGVAAAPSNHRKS